MSWWTLPKSNLEYFLRKLKGKLDGKVDKVTGLGLSSNDYTTADKNKLSGIASGAQVNVIETVKVNNTALTPSSKAVNITVPTKVSELTNDSGYTTNTGTVTQVKVGTTAYNPSSGVVSLPAYPTTLPASDVYAWAKASTKPAYTLDEVSDGSTRKLANYLPLSGGTVTGQTTFNTSIHDAGGQTIFAGGATSSAWYKITLATHGVTPPQSQQWYMCSMTIHPSGSYSYAAKGIIELSYYIYWTGTAFVATNVYATGIGNNLQNIVIYYKITDPFVIYVNLVNTYTSLFVDKVSYRDSSHAHRTKETKVETCSAITVSEYTNVPIVKLYTCDGNQLYINDDIYPSTNNAFDLGASIAKWRNVYAGTFNGDLNGNASSASSVAWSGVTDKPSSFTPSSHTHGNIQNGGTLQTNDITIASGDKLVVTDSSDSSKIARASISFDGSTATKCLTQKGTWESFLSSHQSVTNKDATLAWSTKSTIATIGSTNITVSLPANPNTDTKVTQTDWADNVNHRVLFSYSDVSGDVTNKVYKSSGFVYNPYIKKLNIGSLNATSSFISLMADSTDGAYVEFSDNTGDVLFKFNSSDQDGYLILGNPTSKKSGTLTLVSSSGSMCTLATQTLSNFRTARLPDASGTILVASATTDTDTTDQEIYFGKGGVAKYHTNRLMYKPSEGNLHIKNSSGQTCWALWDDDIDRTTSGNSYLELGNRAISDTDVGARRGCLSITGFNQYASDIKAGDLTADRHLTLPDISGFLLAMIRSDIPEGATNLSQTATAHSITAYQNGFTIPYQMDNTNDGGIIRCRGTSEANCTFEMGTWDDSGGGETIMFTYYPTTSQVNPTYTVTVPKKSGTIALTSDISDIRCKDDITPIDDAKLEAFYNDLAPSRFKVLAPNESKYHYGFIAQDVMHALNDISVDAGDKAFIGTFKNEDGEERYSLAYREFIAMNTRMIQILKDRIESQAQEIAELKERTQK